MSFKDEILYALEELRDGTFLLLSHKLSMQRITYPKVTFYNTIRRLEQKGLVKKVRKGPQVYLSLTARGKALVKRPVAKRARKDGLSTIIIFDIPEKQRKAREALRRYLLRSGYINLQRSVMISPFVAGAELKELLAEMKLQSHVSVILGRIDHYFR